MQVQELLESYSQGVRDFSGADLSGADLWRANLSGADLWRANLSGADLIGADLSGADLSGADLWRANLREADLSGADLSGANLRGANLSGANLREADLSGADLCWASLSGASLSGECFEGVEPVADLDGQILEKVSADRSCFSMRKWHSGCGSAHCRAGWAVTLHPRGEELEEKLGPNAAGALIYAVSYPELRVPDFFASTEDALEDMRERAKLAEVKS